MNEKIIGIIIKSKRFQFQIFFTWTKNVYREICMFKRRKWVQSWVRERKGRKIQLKLFHNPFSIFVLFFSQRDENHIQRGKFSSPKSPVELIKLCVFVQGRKENFCLLHLMHQFYQIWEKSLCINLTLYLPLFLLK